MFIDWVNTDFKIREISWQKWPANVTVDPDWSGYVESNQIWIPNQGSGKIHTHRGDVRFEKGTIFWLRPGFYYRATQTKKNPFDFFKFEFDLIDSNGDLLLSEQSLPTEAIIEVDYNYFKILFEDLIKIKNRIRNTENLMEKNSLHEQISCLVRLLLMEIDEVVSLQPQKEKPDQLYNIKDDPLAFIAYRFRHELSYRPSIKELAKEVYMTANGFSMAFKKSFGQSPEKYAISCRIEHASRLLMETDMKVKQIANILGYSDPQLLTRQFCNLIGCTPSEYRNRK